MSRGHPRSPSAESVWRNEEAVRGVRLRSPSGGVRRPSAESVCGVRLEERGGCPRSPQERLGVTAVGRAGLLPPASHGERPGMWPDVL